MTKLLAAVLLVALVGVGLLVFVGGTSEKPVPATRPRVADVESVLRTNGRVRAAGRVEVFSSAAGLVRELRVAVGDQVRQGAVLAILENAEARAAEAAAETQLEQARARRTRAKTPWLPSERLEFENQIKQVQLAIDALAEDRQSTAKLVDQGAAPRSELALLDRQFAEYKARLELLRTQLAAEPLKASIAEAEAAVREAERELEESRRIAASASIRAPVAGEVYSLAVERGAFVAAGSLIARIAGDGAVQVLVFVDEPELGRIRPGIGAHLTASAYPEKAWNCVLDRGPTEVIELGARRVGEVLCRVEGDSDQLIPNLTVDVEIEGESAKSALTVPREALVRTEAGDAVWTSSNGIASRRAVEVGVRGANRVEIVSGLVETDVVLLPGMRELTEGESVETTAQGDL